MGTILTREYADFERQMDEEGIFMDESLSFKDICARIGADPESLEQVISEELGCLGDELLEVYRDKSLL